MSLNSIDLASIGVVSLVAAIQFLRGIKDFSRIFYETLFIIGAVSGATYLYKPLHSATGLPWSVCFLGTGVILSVVGILLAAMVNRKMAFGLGVFGYVFALLFAVACGYALGHLALRGTFMAMAPTNPAFAAAVQKSWMARDLLYFKTFVETRAILRQARWLNI